jgi:hypothetical protein
LWSRRPRVRVPSLTPLGLVMPIFAGPVYWCGVYRGTQIAVARRKARDASQSQIRELNRRRDLTWCGPRVTFSMYGLLAPDSRPLRPPRACSRFDGATLLRLLGAVVLAVEAGASLRRLETLAGRPAQARAFVGDHACLSKEQRPSAARRVAGRCSIRPTQLRADARTCAPRQLLWREAGVSPCAPGRRPRRSSPQRGARASFHV